MKKYTIILVLAAMLLLTGCGYNQMVTNRENVNAAWGQVENMYQRRANLIPNIVETVKGYATHEQETLTAVIEARSRATAITATPENMEAMQEYMDAQGDFGNAISRMLMVTESYPQLQANALYADLIHELEGTENRISVAIMDYNNTVRTHNTMIQKFPYIIYSGMLGFQKITYFESKEGADVAPVVDFSK